MIVDNICRYCWRIKEALELWNNIILKRQCDLISQSPGTRRSRQSKPVGKTSAIICQINHAKHSLMYCCISKMKLTMHAIYIGECALWLALKLRKYEPLYWIPRWNSMPAVFSFLKHGTICKHNTRQNMKYTYIRKWRQTDCDKNGFTVTLFVKCLLKVSRPIMTLPIFLQSSGVL